MKQIKFQWCLFILISFFTLNMIYSQEWAPIGAKWFYSTPGTAGGGGLLIIESHKDTIIEAKNCKKLKFSDIKQQAIGVNEYIWDTLVTYEFFYYNSDSIEHFDRSNDYFYKLYDFTIEDGDTILVRDDQFPGEFPYSNFEYIVDSSAIHEINDTELKFFYVQATESADWIFAPLLQSIYPVIEKIGSVVSFLGISLDKFSQDWGNQYFLRCYIDENINYRNELFPVNFGCDYLINQIDVRLSEELDIYPNPVRDYLRIFNTIDDNYSVRLFNMDGLMLLQKQRIRDELLDLKMLSAGIYLLQISNKNNVVRNKLIVKL